MEEWEKLSDKELNNIYKVMLRSSASRNSATIREIEAELSKRAAG